MSKRGRLGVVALAVAGAFTLAVAAVGASNARVSETAAGVGGNGSSSNAVISSDGTVVAFLSDADNLVPGDTNDVQDVFVKEIATGTVTRVSVASDGTQGNEESGSFGSLDVSADGRYVVFSSDASNLSPEDTNDFQDIFVHDRATGTTEWIPPTPTGGPSTSNSSEPAISDDGRYVAFLATTSSYAGLHDRDIGTTRYLLESPGVDLSAVGIDMSADGQYVAVSTRALGEEATFLRYDTATDTYQRADERTAGVASNRSNWVNISDDGRYLAYTSADGNIIIGDNDDLVDVFVWDAQTGTIDLIESDSLVGGDQLAIRPRLSADGRFVTFVPSYINDAYDPTPVFGYEVYRYDRTTDTAIRISEYDDGTDPNGNSHAPTMSGDGNLVAFETTEPFDADDDEGWWDIYLVDVEGTTEPPTPEACTFSFDDVPDTHTFVDDICWLAQQGITLGCNTARTQFCPADPVTRGQMAAFLVRALDYTDDGGGDLFTDDDTSTFESDIDKLGTAGVTRGCNPTGTEFCPADPVTRGQMAAFLVRALDYTDDGGGDLFTDDDTSTFESDIDKLATAGVTLGCNPGLFCPDDLVTRGQMAAFLRRALDI